MNVRRIGTVTSLSLVFVVLMGCEKQDGSKPKKDEVNSSASAEGKAATEKSSKGDGTAKSAKGATGATATCGDAASIPKIPTTESSPPTVAEWKSGCAVNTQGANSQAKDCSLKVVREWAKLACTGKVLGHEKMEDFGQEGQNHFKMFKKGELGSFVWRLRKGHSQKVRICRANNRASLFVSWPGSKPQPTIIALAHGDACDGSDWGSAAKK